MDSEMDMTPVQREPEGAVRAERPQMRMRHNLLWTLAGNAVYMGCQWGVIFVTVKLGNAEMVGQISLGFAICAPIFLLSHLRLRTASATDARVEFRPADYLTLRLVSTIATMIALAGFCLLSGMKLMVAQTVLLVATAKAIESGSDILYGLAQGAERMKSISLSMILRGVLSLSGFGWALWHTHRLLPSLTWFCMGWGAVLFLYDLPQARGLARESDGGGLGIRWDGRVMWALVRMTAPLGVSAMMMSFALNLPRYYVEHYLGPAQLGIFSAIAYLTIAGGVVVNALAESTVPRFAKYFATGDRTAVMALMIRVTAITALLGAAGILCSVFWGRAVLNVLYRREYADQGNLFLWMMVAAALGNISSVFTYLLVAGRWFGMHLICLLILTATMAIGCAIAVPRLGATGAAAGSIAGFAMQLLVAGWMLRKQIRSMHHVRDLRVAAANLAIATR